MQALVALLEIYGPVRHDLSVEERVTGSDFDFCNGPSGNAIAPIDKQYERGDWVWTSK